MFWTLRTFEDRDEYIFDLNSIYHNQYMEEKIETHKLNMHLKTKQFNLCDEIFLLFIILLFSFIIIKNIHYIEYDSLKNVIGIGCLLPSSKFVKAFPTLRRLTDHKIIVNEREITNNSKEFTLTTCSSSKFPKELTNQGRFPLVSHMYNSTKNTTVPNNCIHVVLEGQEAVDFQTELQQNYQMKKANEPHIDHQTYDQNLLHVYSNLEKGLGDNLATSPLNTVTLNHLSEANASLHANTYHLVSEQKLFENKQTVYNNFIISPIKTKANHLNDLLQNSNSQYSKAMSAALFANQQTFY